MEFVLRTESLSKNYKHIIAIKNLSLAVRPGNVYGILGPNGSGKTTTLAVITGVIKPNSGKYFWFENRPNPEVRKKIGSLIEVPYFYPYLNLVKNLKIIAAIKGIPESDIERVLKTTNLYKRRHSPYYSLSLGMKQRLALAAVLLGDPEVLVLDEPANGLDPEGIAEVREIIKIEAQKAKTIILASHILDEVEKVCTHVAVLKNGETLAQGNVHELLATDDPVIVSSENIEQLKEEIIRAGFAKSVNKENNDLILILQKGHTAKDVNQFAFDKGFTLSKLVTRKKSLESQFLELVK